MPYSAWIGSYERTQTRTSPLLWPRDSQPDRRSRPLPCPSRQCVHQSMGVLRLLRQVYRTTGHERANRVTMKTYTIHCPNDPNYKLFTTKAICGAPIDEKRDIYHQADLERMAGIYSQEGVPNADPHLYIACPDCLDHPVYILNMLAQLL